MDERERIERWNDKEDLLDEIAETMGHEPEGVRRCLAILTHPAVLEHTIKYFKGLDDSHVCVKYEQPWSCAKVAEINYESVTPHWIASQQTIVIGGDWCTPCRNRALSKS